jgi:hypothetical protein
MDLRTFKDRKKGSQIAYQQNEIHKSQKNIRSANRKSAKCGKSANVTNYLQFGDLQNIFADRPSFVLKLMKRMIDCFA